MDRTLAVGHVAPLEGVGDGVPRAHRVQQAPLAVAHPGRGGGSAGVGSERGGEAEAEAAAAGGRLPQQRGRRALVALGIWGSLRLCGRHSLDREQGILGDGLTGAHGAQDAPLPAKQRRRARRRAAPTATAQAHRYRLAGADGTQHALLAVDGGRVLRGGGRSGGERERADCEQQHGESDWCGAATVLLQRSVPFRQSDAGTGAWGGGNLWNSQICYARSPLSTYLLTYLLTYCP